MNGQLAALMSALTFFSRFPVPRSLAGMPFVEAAAAAPLAGAVVAVPPAILVAVLLVVGASPLLAATVGVLALVIATGALHEDGLADCADGFFGAAERSRRLEIMHDSRIGAFGVLALIGAVLIKVAVLEAAIAKSPWAALFAFVAAAAAARAVSLYPWVALPGARAEGLAARIGQPTVATFRKALLWGIAITALLTVWWAPVGFLVAGVAVAAAAKACALLADRLIGGHTGDVIGATIVVTDLTYLAAITMWAL
ncbi:MAG: adenosylcobinamide-GDP ribazoletransferase [Pseudomonadota bacterium]